MNNKIALISLLLNCCCYIHITCAVTYYFIPITIDYPNYVLSAINAPNEVLSIAKNYPQSWINMDIKDDMCFTASIGTICWPDTEDSRLFAKVSCSTNNCPENVRNIQSFSPIVMPINYVIIMNNTIGKWQIYTEYQYNNTIQLFSNMGTTDAIVELIANSPWIDYPQYKHIIKPISTFIKHDNSVLEVTYTSRVYLRNMKYSITPSPSPYNSVIPITPITPITPNHTKDLTVFETVVLSISILMIPITCIICIIIYNKKVSPINKLSIPLTCTGKSHILV